MMRYDEKTFIRALDGHKVEIIAKNIENFITFGIKAAKVNIKFLDSLKFLNGSLDTLTKNLLSKGEQSFKYTRLLFEQDFDFDLLQKGVFPYEFVTHESILDTTTTLPPIQKFYSRLKGENISNSDYTHARNIWNRFSCKNA